MPVEQKVISIVNGALKPTGPAKVTRTLSNEVRGRIAKFKQDIAEYEQIINKEPIDKPIWEKLLLIAKEKLERLQNSAKEIVTTVTEYIDSKGAKYVETITKDGSSFGTGTPVRRLVKTEVSFLPDGKKIITTTTQDRGDMFLLGEGDQDGFIEKVEELEIPNIGVVARRTTSHHISDYCGVNVMKEISRDGQELSEHNTVANSRYFFGGKCVEKNSYDGVPGFAYMQKFEVNEKGIAHPIADAPKTN